MNHSKEEQELSNKLNKLSFQNGNDPANIVDDGEDVTPNNRGRFFSSMNYKEYVSKFDKPPALPKIMPQQGGLVADMDFSLDAEELPQTRGYSMSLPMRPLDSSGSSSFKSNFDSRTIEEEDNDDDEAVSNPEVPIFAVDQLPKNEVVDTILQNNETIRSRSQSDNFSNQSIFNFCSSVRSKRMSIIN